ncbi:MAG: hypothetical protein TREMPRED_005454, partial [Tremellales sp. Tagirdzhanova-0007]
MTSTAQEPYRLGYVGLGNLGTEICKNLGRHASSQNLTPLSLYNRTSAKYSAVSDECPGAHFAEEVAEVVQRSNVVFTCLLDDAAAEEVYGKIFKAVKREDKVVFVDQSTLTPTRARRLESQAREAGAIYLSCPVFGNPPVAKAAQLVLVVSGAEEGRSRLKPLLVPAIGRSIIDVGEDVGK